MSSLRNVLLAGKFRTFSQLNEMSRDSLRNTLIVELSKHSKQTKQHFQAMHDDEVLAGAGAVMVFLRHTQAVTDDELKSLDDTQQREKAIERIRAYTGTPLTQLRDLSSMRLVQLAFGPADSFLTGVLFAGHFRTLDELQRMSQEDRRNTLIVELATRTNQSGDHLQGMDNPRLAGVGAIFVFLRHTQARSDAELKRFSEEDLRNLMIVAMNTQTQKPIAVLRDMSNINLAKLVFGPHNVRPPVVEAGNRPFKLRVRHAGQEIGNGWLGRHAGSTGSDPYDWYCAASGEARVFTWYHHRDGRRYLKDQDGNWLSHTRADGWLYMSYWPNAVGWRIEGGRLVRDEDNAVMTWRTDTGGVFLKGHYYLSVDNDATRAVTVEVVDAELTSAESLIDHMAGISVRQHKSTGVSDPDRYLFTAPRKLDSLAVAERDEYLPQEVTLVGLRQPVEQVKTQPVYLLRMPSEDGQRTYYKLSAQKAEGGYSLDPLSDASPNFYAFASEQKAPFLVQVYEHAAANPTDGNERYYYDNDPNGHHEWGPGTAMFRAISPAEAEKALIGSLGSQYARDYATEWANQHGETVASMLKGLGKDDVQNRDVVRKLQDTVPNLPPLKYISLGAGAHGGWGLGAAGIESGAIWRQEEFGHSPMLEPLANYSVEWTTLGVGGINVGGSVDVFAIGMWFGDMSQVEGGCNGVTIAGQFVGGIGVGLWWDGSWKGAQKSAHPIGVTVIASVGPEIGAGMWYSASATQFFNRRPNFPKT